MALTDNLISYWKLDETSGNASDSVGSNTLTNTNVTYAAGKLGNGVSFSATGQVLTKTSPSGLPTGQPQMTISAWIKTSGTGLTQPIVSWGNALNGQASIVYINSANNVNFSPYVGQIGSTKNVCDGIWHLVTAVVINNTTGYIYIDGIDTSTNLSGMTMNIQTGTLRIGADMTGAYSTNLLIDEVGIWSRALSADEVSQLYNSNRALAYPLTAPTLYGGVAYYKMDEASGNASDSIGLLGTATNVGTTTYSAAKINNGSVHNGSNQYFTLNDLRLTNLTISLWVNFTSIPTSGNSMGLFNTLNAVNGGGGYRFCYDNGGGTPALSSIIAIASNPIQYNTNNKIVTFTTGTWYHVVLTYDGTYSKLYVNAGASTDSNNKTGSIAYGGTQTYRRIASDKTWSGAPDFVLNGMLDEIGIWNRALTSTEISTLYNGGAGLQYPFTTANTTNFFHLF